MTARRLIFTILLIAMIGVLAGSQGLAYARQTYGAPCGNPGGIPGLLVKMNLLTLGNCDTKGPRCAQVGAACGVKNPGSGRPTAGHCTQLNTSCACVAN